MEAADVLKERVLKVLDDLPPQQVAQVLDFALFVKERHPMGLPTEGTSQQSQASNVWALLASLQGSIDGPVDWSVEHDHYLYDTASG
jgi:hypothetical protein